MGKKILAVVIGLVLCNVLMMVLQGVGHQLWGAPEDKSMEAVAAFIEQADLPALLWPTLSYVVGGFAGAFLAAKIGRSRGPAWVVGVIMTALAVAMVFMLPQPAWIAALNVVAFPVVTFFGISLSGVGAADGGRAAGVRP